MVGTTLIARPAVDPMGAPGPASPVAVASHMSAMVSMAAASRNQKVPASPALRQVCPLFVVGVSPRWTVRIPRVSMARAASPKMTICAAWSTAGAYRGGARGVR